jgi:hypothetical protein
VNAAHTASALAWTNEWIVKFSFAQTNTTGHLGRNILTFIELHLMLDYIRPTRIGVYHYTNIVCLLFVRWTASASVNLALAGNKIILTQIEVKIRYSVNVRHCDSLRHSVVVLKIHFCHVSGYRSVNAALCSALLGKYLLAFHSFLNLNNLTVATSLKFLFNPVTLQSRNFEVYSTKFNDISYS